MGLLNSRAGQETTFKACGQRWKAARQGRDVWDKWIEWAKGFLPDPLVVAHAHVSRLAEEEQATLADETLSDESRARKTMTLQAEQERVTRIALEQATGWLALNSSKTQSLLFSPQGASEMLYLQLEANHPGLDREDAWMIFEEMGTDAVMKVFNRTSGQAPKSEKNGSAPAA